MMHTVEHGDRLLLLCRASSSDGKFGKSGNQGVELREGEIESREPGRVLFLGDLPAREGASQSKGEVFDDRSRTRR